MSSGVNYDEVIKGINSETLAEAAKSAGIKNIDKVPIKKVKEMVKSMDKSKMSKFNCIIISAKRQVKCKKINIGSEYIITPYSELRKGPWINDNVKIAYLKNGRSNKMASEILDLPIKGDLIIYLERDATLSDFNQVISTKDD